MQTLMADVDRWSERAGRCVAALFCNHSRTLLPDVNRSSVYPRSWNSVRASTVGVAALRLMKLASHLAIVALIAPIALAEESPAFALEGVVESVFAGKPHNSGVFSVNAFQQKALIDVLYENGHREIVGTDGFDSFLYSPFNGPDTSTNREAIASISPGRLPADAHPFAQMLWLVCTHDEGLLSQLHELEFYFHGDYMPGELSVLFESGDALPKLVNAIRWYAPGHARHGTNRYALTLYPQGWLLAGMSVTETASVGGLSLPAAITFTRNAMLAVTNAAQLAALEARKRDDVRVVERVTFTVTNARIERALSTYIPEVIDDTTRIHDKRVNVIAKVKSGKWWTIRDHWPELSKRRQSPRVVIVLLLLTSSAFLYLALRAVVARNRKDNRRNIEKGEST